MRQSPSLCKYLLPLTKHLFGAWYSIPQLITFKSQFISFARMRHRKVKPLAQGDKASEKQSWDSNPGLLVGKTHAPNQEVMDLF